MSQEANEPLVFLRAGSQEPPRDQPFVAIATSWDELNQWLRDPAPALQWIQVEGLLDDPEAWAQAAQGNGGIPLDVVLSAPGRDFPNLYRLVDVRSVREVRVSMRATPGFLNALRLAASLGLPVRLLPGQPFAGDLEALATALDFYLHDPMVEAPIEFFHSVLAWTRGAETGSLWTILEEDPASFQRPCAGHQRVNPGALDDHLNRGSTDFVSRHLAGLVAAGAECATCAWQQVCQGYFKWPEPRYSCQGVKQLFASLQAAADEIESDLAMMECSTSTPMP